MNNILIAASECVPFIKTGGLADVAGSLPGYLDHEMFDARVILPKYLCIPEAYRSEMKLIAETQLFYNGCMRYLGVLELVHKGITYYFIDNEAYFGGSSPYTDARYDEEKFGFFSKAILEVLPLIGFRPEVIHCNDWHTGLVSAYIREYAAADGYYRGIRTIMTIHNLRFQGAWDLNDVRAMTGLPRFYFTSEALEFYGSANYLKGSILLSDTVTTVSDTYKDEIRTPAYGEGLEHVLEYRTPDLYGIVNGLDYDELDPMTDSSIPVHFSAADFRQKRSAARSALAGQLGLDDDGSMLVGIVSRLTDQKGFDLVAEVMETMINDGIRFVILGTGEKRYEDMFRHFASGYPGRISANIAYSEALARQIYAGTDAFLMPSLFEPCGLSQLMALRYGSVPIVRETGGLKDTVEAYNEYKGTGTGFSFAEYSSQVMLNTVCYAKQVFDNDREAWEGIVERGMRMDFSWSASARAYEELYMSLIMRR